ncbi:hypothetical protein CPB85DRAFT_1318327 [Mucidula mucida]|nr:hypothetical protein CPB85DRAFT_1318327 [Mucidula mucida]
MLYCCIRNGISILRPLIPNCSVAIVSMISYRSTIFCTSLGLLRDMHGTEEYGAGNLAVMIHLPSVVQNGFDGVNGRLDSMQAMIENGRTRALNLRASPDPTHMLRKTVSGSGQELATSIANGTPVPAAVNPPPAVGAIFAYNPIALDSLTLRNILSFTVFYNEDFGILSNDDLAVRIFKFRLWLTT